MGDAHAGREQAARHHGDDVVEVLVRQHHRIRELFSEVRSAHQDARKQMFDELRALLAVHEAAEEVIVRPVAKDTAGKEEVKARNEEEREANKVLARLERMDLESPAFEEAFADFERSVLDHAAHEEAEEFPAVRAGRTEEQLRGMGRRLVAVERLAPTHPHPTVAGSPTAQRVTGPFAAMMDRARDALARSSH